MKKLLNLVATMVVTIFLAVGISFPQEAHSEYGLPPVDQSVQDVNQGTDSGNGVTSADEKVKERTVYEKKDTNSRNGIHPLDALSSIVGLIVLILLVL